MSTVLHYLPYVLLFALATMLIYGWGLVRAQRQSLDLTRQLYSRSLARIRRQMKQSGGSMTRREIEEAVRGVRAGAVFSKHKVGVTEPRQFVDALLPYLIEQRVLEQYTEHGTLRYRLRKK